MSVSLRCLLEAALTLSARASEKVGGARERLFPPLSPLSPALKTAN